MIIQRSKLLLGVLWLLSSVGCGIFGTEQDEAAKGPEAVLEANVKKALIADGGIDAAAIGIGIAGKRVTLTGFVGNAAERRRAELITGQVRGVEQVVNRIEVRGDDR